MIQPSSSRIIEDEVEGADDVPGPSVPRKSNRTRKAKSFGYDFQLYLVEGTRDKTVSLREYCYIIKEDPRILSEAMAYRDVLGCKWILKRKMKVDGSIYKYKARLVIQGFRQKKGIDFFDTYAPVARITTIRLLLAFTAIHDLVINQMDINTAFLNGDLDKEIYMKQPKGFVMSGHENKVCKLKKSLYGLKQAPKQRHQKFDEVVLSNGFSLNQADKCVYSRFDDSGNGLIICLYADDMLIFGTDQDQVDKTKELLSSNFDMKDLREAEVILGIRIKRGNNGISVSQYHYIEKILTKFNFENCSPVSTPVDPTVKFRSNNGTPVSQLEYSRAVGCLMYAMISTRRDIAFDVGKLSSGYPSIIEGYSDASWINNMEDHSSTSGWVFLLGGGAICWASKKQTCIIGSTMESEFVALAAAGNKAEWLRNLVYEIPLWPKPVSTTSRRCDNYATLANAYTQVYNGKSRHLADHLTKGLARDLGYKAAIGIVPLIPIFIASDGPLIASSCRILAIACQMAEFLRVRALCSARAIVVKLALVAPWKSSSILIPSPVPAATKKSASRKLDLVLGCTVTDMEHSTLTSRAYRSHNTTSRTLASSPLRGGGGGSGGGSGGGGSGSVYGSGHETKRLHAHSWKYLSVSFVNSSPEVKTLKFDGMRSPLATCAKGSYDMAKKANLMTKIGISTFYFDDNQSDHDGEPFLKKQKEFDNQKEKHLDGRCKDVVSSNRKLYEQFEETLPQSPFVSRDNKYGSSVKLSRKTKDACNLEYITHASISLADEEKMKESLSNGKSKKHSKKKNSASPFLRKELTRLRYAKSSPEIILKDSIRRISPTYFVANRFTRTKKMLQAMALGKLVMTPLWLESCAKVLFCTSSGGTNSLLNTNVVNAASHHFQ
nr:zinc finger, CCHC-type [Tanacetum cinerariifolium]